MIFDLDETKISFSEKTVERLKSQIKSNNFHSNETCYLYQLILSLKNYLDYLKVMKIETILIFYHYYLF